MKLDGVSAVVTGGASGLGAATVAWFRQQGAAVVVLDRAAGDDHQVGLVLEEEDQREGPLQPGERRAQRFFVRRVKIVFGWIGVERVGDVGEVAADLLAEHRNLIELGLEVGGADHAAEGDVGLALRRARALDPHDVAGE